MNPIRRFEHIHTDLVGPLPISNGYQYCLTIIDRFTRWPEAIPVTDITTETITKRIFEEWITRYGTPARLTTDQGKQFERPLPTTHTAYRFNTPQDYSVPASNKLEKLYRQIKAAIKCHETEDWTSVLPVILVILLGVRTARKENLKTTTTKLVYGKPLRLPGQFLEEHAGKSSENMVSRLRKIIEKLCPRTKRHGENALRI